MSPLPPPSTSSSSSFADNQCKLHLGGIGRAIAQAVSRWLPTPATRIRARSDHVGFVAHKMPIGQIFSEYFGFPCLSSFHQILRPHKQPEQVQ
jgi:hypothetical protein